MSNLQRTIQGRGHTTLICAACNAIFTRPNAHIRGTTHACSRDCSQKLRPRKPKTLLQCICKTCGKQFEVRKGWGGTGEYCSIPCLAKTRGEKMRGPQHPKWNGGTSKRKHNSRKVIAQIIAEKGKCEECDSTKNLQGHHIKSHSAEPSLRADPTNIQVLCVQCHAEKHPKLSKFILAGHVHA
jgi:5-methylcytosine-specific restriction endonuclease McrA